jgi:2-(1,2-epoxy-1,2-dihydrophenyl)acetyl-CoA isomerase
VGALERSLEGGVLTLTLRRPDGLNALGRELLGELREALAGVGPPQVRAVVLTAEGRAFSVGQDLGELREASAGVGSLLREGYHPVVLALRSLEVPVLAALNGPAAGAGLSLALACDVRVAAASAVLVPAFAGIGLVPDAGCTHALARMLGPQRALAWLISNRRLDAGEALALGLVDEVVPDEQLPRVAAERAAALAAGPTRAIGLTKRLLNGALEVPLEEQLEREARAQEQAMAGGDFDEGVAAFLEKRPPRFRGV